MYISKRVCSGVGGEVCGCGSGCEMTAGVHVLW